MLQEYLIYLAMVLLLGTLISALASKLKISNIFLLVISGMILGSIGLISFPDEVILLISTLAMIMITFDSTVKMKFKEIESFSSDSMKIITIYFLLNMIIISFASYHLFFNDNRFSSIVLSVIFASLIFGIDSDITLSCIKRKKKKKLLCLMETETLISRPITLIIPLILLNYMVSPNTNPYLPITEELFILFSQVILGTALGIGAGFLIVAILNTDLKEEISFLISFSSAIILYVIAENIGANSALSLTIFALIFGNYHIKHKVSLKKFSSIISYILNIFVFILIGTTMLIEFQYILKGTILFFVSLIIRLIAIFISLKKSRFKLKEKLFYSLSVSRGIDTSIIILIMMTQFSKISGIQTIINLSLLFSLYGYIIANILTLFSEKMTN